MIICRLKLSNNFIEIALEQPILNDPIFFELALSKILGDLGCNFSSVLQNFPLVEF